MLIFERGGGWDVAFGADGLRRQALGEAEVLGEREFDGVDA
jgi:hypothetical protein